MTTDVAVRAHAQVTGTVQGVGFRYFVYHAARELGLAGWVRNVRTGAVELEVEGSRGDVDHLLDAVKQGPTPAVVRDVHIEWITPLGERGFEVRS